MLSVTVFFSVSYGYRAFEHLAFDFAFSTWKLAFFWCTPCGTRWADRRSGMERQQLLGEGPAGASLHCAGHVPEQHWQCPREKVCPRESVLSLGELRSLFSSFFFCFPCARDWTWDFVHGKHTLPLSSFSQDSFTALITRTLYKFCVAVCIDAGDNQP